MDSKMNIQTVAENLRVTIAGKEQALAEYLEARKANDENWSGDARITDASLFATIEFLKINIDELKRILQDVEQSCRDNLDFDERVSVPLDLDNDVILALALEAHKRDITINKMVELVLQRAIDENVNSNQE